MLLLLTGRIVSKALFGISYIPRAPIVMAPAYALPHLRTSIYLMNTKIGFANSHPSYFLSCRFQGAFNFPFSIGRNSLSIVQHGDKFELRINNQSFDHLYNQSKYIRSAIIGLLILHGRQHFPINP